MIMIETNSVYYTIGRGTQMTRSWQIKSSHPFHKSQPSSPQSSSTIHQSPSPEDPGRELAWQDVPSSHVDWNVDDGIRHFQFLEFRPDHVAMKQIQGNAGESCVMCLERVMVMWCQVSQGWGFWSASMWCVRAGEELVTIQSYA